MPTSKPTAYPEVREISNALNNAAAYCFNSKEIKTTSPERMKHLRAYAAAILDVVVEHRKQGEVTAEELIFVLTLLPLFTQVFYVDKTASKKLSMFQDISKRMLEDQEGIV